MESPRFPNVGMGSFWGGAFYFLDPVRSLGKVTPNQGKEENKHVQKMQ